MVRVPRLVRPAALVLAAAMTLLAPAAGLAMTLVLVPDEPADGILDSPQRYYAFWLPEGVWAAVALTSIDFDPYLVILGPDGVDPRAKR